MSCTATATATASVAALVAEDDASNISAAATTAAPVAASTTAAGSTTSAAAAVTAATAAAASTSVAASGAVIVLSDDAPPPTDEDLIEASERDHNSSSGYDCTTAYLDVLTPTNARRNGIYYAWLGDQLNLERLLTRSVLRHDVAAGVNPFASLPDTFQGPLQRAAHRGHAGIVKLLVDSYHVPVDSFSGRTPMTALMVAVHADSLDVVRVLVTEYKADANLAPRRRLDDGKIVIDHDYVAPRPYLMDFMIRYNRARCLDLMLSLGCFHIDPNVHYFVPLHYATAVVLLKYLRPPVVRYPTIGLVRKNLWYGRRRTILCIEALRSAFEPAEQRRALVETFILGDAVPTAATDSAAAAAAAGVPAVTRSFFRHRMFEREVVPMIRDFIAAPLTKQQRDALVCSPPMPAPLFQDLSSDYDRYWEDDEVEPHYDADDSEYGYE